MCFEFFPNYYEAGNFFPRNYVVQTWVTVRFTLSCVRFTLTSAFLRPTGAICDFLQDKLLRSCDVYEAVFEEYLNMADVVEPVFEVTLFPKFTPILSCMVQVKWH